MAYALGNVVSEPPEANLSSFSATNGVLIGVFLKLLEKGTYGAAEAWARAHSCFVGPPSPKSATTLVVTPVSDEDAALLVGVQTCIETAIELYAGYRPSSARRDVSSLNYKLMPPDAHPNMTRRAWLAALKVSVEASMAVRTGNDLAALSQFHRLLSDATLGAAATAYGRQDLFMLTGLRSEQQAHLHDVIYSVSDILRKDRKVVDTPLPEFDRFSPPVGTVAASELRRAGWTGLVTRKDRPVVGVIVPGGNAAPSDVKSILATVDGIEIEPIVVERGPVLTMGRRILRAVDALRDAEAVAVIVGYGGTNEGGVLDAVLDGLAPELTRPAPPTYIGLGHANYRRTIQAPTTRWCKTPSDAAHLFALEAVELPRERSNLLERAKRDLLDAFAQPDRNADIFAQLQADLGDIDSRLNAGREKHLQGDWP